MIDVGRVYRLRADLPDWRDLLHDVEVGLHLTSLPASVDLRPGCPPVVDQGSLGCHDEQTEVLTEAGWKAWTDYTGAERVGTVNPLTKALEFQRPSLLHAYDYDGPMYYSGHHRLDFAVTPNHRMWVRSWDESARTLRSNYGFREMQDVGWYAGMLAAPSGHRGVTLDGVTIGRRSYSGDDFLALIALVVSDGWIGATANNRNVVSFCCFRADRRDMVAALAHRLGIGEVPSRPGVWKWSDPELAVWLRANIYTGNEYRSPFKRIPAIVKAADQRQIGLFLEFFGDQHIGNQRQFYSTSPQMVDDLQELLLRAGKRSGVYERPMRDTVMSDGRKILASGHADLTLTEATTDRLSLERKKNVQVERYRGPVFCATVPNGLLVTRRNKSVLVSGNSCTANAIVAALEYDEIRQGQHEAPLSRLFLYYNERAAEDTIDSDAGASIRDGIKVVNRLGVCLESTWGYDTRRFADEPSNAAYVEASRYRSVAYRRVPRGTIPLRAALAAGFPVVFGFSVFESFESGEVANTGVVPMPERGEQMLGGHAVVLVGFDDASQRFLVRNSWGTGWGMDGYCTMPYEYLAHRGLASDFWSISRVLQEAT